jgi:dimethylpropiothetin dethiomethylase
MTELRLSDAPSWIYLLREYYEIYRYLPSGGSSLIRAHQKSVREAISRVMNANAMLALSDPVDKPVTMHFQRALDEGRRERHADFIRTIDTVREHLVWQYGYEKIPRGLKDKYAYAELCGPSGPIVSKEVILGLVLFAPACTYPAHAHDGITESYVCLSGAVSENHQGVYAPGSLIFNPPNQRHRITVSDREPALMIYAWIGPSDQLLNQKMMFTRVAKN